MPKNRKKGKRGKLDAKIRRLEKLIPALMKKHENNKKEWSVRLVAQKLNAKTQAHVLCALMLLQRHGTLGAAFEADGAQFWLK